MGQTVLSFEDDENFVKGQYGSNRMVFYDIFVVPWF